MRRKGKDGLRKMKKKVTLAIDENILTEIDKIRDYVPRSAYVNHILEWFIELKMGDAHEFRKLFSK